MSSWIDEFANGEDDKTLFEEFMSGFYKSRHFKQFGWSHTWYWIKGIMKDAEYIADDSGSYSATDSKELTKKRVKRDD